MTDTKTIDLEKTIVSQALEIAYLKRRLEAESALSSHLLRHPLKNLKSVEGSESDVQHA